jgi:hypothetical protein
MIALGTKVRDRVTGFVGIVTGRAEHLSGQHLLKVQPKADENKAVPVAEWFDEGRLDVLPA